MKKIGVVTSTRAEYGLLRLSLKKIMEDPDLELCLIVTGSHLLRDQGHTIDEIISDGIPVSDRVEMFGNRDEGEDDADYLASSMGRALAGFSSCYRRHGIDMLVVLGDRYELIPICYPAMLLNIPIAHISGGEVTEGAIDDTVRHCITKMSYLHFPGCEAYRKRVIQLGEEPERVFNFGDPGIENIKKTDFLSKEELYGYLGIEKDKRIACVTFHPVTHEKDTAGKQTKALISALSAFRDIEFVITMSNMDSGGDEINRLFREASEKYSNLRMYASLGSLRYLSALKYSEAVIGNSSSGIVEAPSLGIPTVNIGDRQKGRLRAASIIDCEAEEAEIENAIKKALSDDFKKVLSESVNPYESGEFSSRFVGTIKDFLINDRIDPKKKFYDL
ncbi:MAG: UDP-N-acetylglucosamine 2-epimerase (hydrolyzing) [Lachnospiraceae bacterium]|nr:UDP-N-acetylglucosamine 2-epimerase (hydrolyzing) [Lachnospiraceae bacterium]